MTQEAIAELAREIEALEVFMDENGIDIPAWEVRDMLNLFHAAGYSRAPGAVEGKRQRLVTRLLALAVDCDETDGWQGASEDVRLAAQALATTPARDDVLEEAAKVADKRHGKYAEPTDWDYGAQDACVAIAAAIRALKGEG